MWGEKIKDFENAYKQESIYWLPTCAPWWLTGHKYQNTLNARNGKICTVTCGETEKKRERGPESKWLTSNMVVYAILLFGPEMFGNTTYPIPFAFLKPSGEKVQIIQFQHSKGKFSMFCGEAQQCKVQNTAYLIKNNLIWIIWQA